MSDSLSVMPEEEIRLILASVGFSDAWIERLGGLKQAG